MDKTAVVDCQRCGDRMRVDVPEFKSEYERVQWEEQAFICKDCSQLDIDPTKIPKLLDEDPKGAMWKPETHQEGYIGMETPEEQLKIIEEDEKRIRERMEAEKKASA